VTLDRMLASVNGLVIDPVVPAEPAPRALLDRSTDCDLLVVGSSGHGGFQGQPLRSSDRSRRTEPPRPGGLRGGSVAFGR